MKTDLFKIKENIYKNGKSKFIVQISINDYKGLEYIDKKIGDKMEFESLKEAKDDLSEYYFNNVVVDEKFYEFDPRKEIRDFKLKNIFL